MVYFSIFVVLYFWFFPGFIPPLVFHFFFFLLANTFYCVYVDIFLKYTVNIFFNMIWIFVQMHDAYKVLMKFKNVHEI